MTVLAGTLALLPGRAAADPGPVIGGLSPVTYTEGGDPVQVAPGITISGGGTFADGYIEFSIAGATADDRLFLPEGTTPDSAEGAITVIGEAVYLGLGGGEHKQIGTVSPPNDGQGGRPLRVNFSAALPNADFSGGVDGNGHPIGRTVNEHQIAMGALASKTQRRAVTISGSGPYTITGTGYSFTTDRNYSPSTKAEWGKEGDERTIAGADFYSAVVSHAGRTQALRLWSVGGECSGPNAGTFCSAFGPDAWSSPFEAKAGDDLAFDWSAANGDDDHEVYGFLVEEGTGVHHELMYSRGGVRNWNTSTGTIPADGTYRFRFVSGTYDGTGGLVVGASLYIDNVRVLSSDATDAVAQSVARLVHYEHTGQNPPSELTIGVSAGGSNGTAGPEEVPTEVTLVDDAPEVDTPSDVELLNTPDADTFATTTGSIDAVDPEGDALSYALVGATANPVTIGGRSYTHSLAGTYGTLHLDGSDGAYAFVPDADAVDARTTADSEQFTLRVSANGLSTDVTLTVRVEIQSSPPGAPTGVETTLGNGTVTVSWDAPTWTGGSDVVDHVIEVSLDGGSTWTPVVASTGSGDTSHVLHGLTPGVEVRVRVTPVNDSGPGTPSEPVAVTPALVPGAPTITSAVAGNRTVTVHLVAPAEDGGATITNYEYSVDGGLTWTARVPASTTSPLVIRPLVNDTTYPIHVRAVNAAGPGAASNQVPVTPRAAPVLKDDPTEPPAPTGTGVLLIDGADAPVTGSSPSRGTLRFSDGGSFQVDLVGLDGDGDPLELDAEGRLIIVAGAYAQVSGEGFRPGTSVDVWLLSTPIHLGDVTVGIDGSFSAMLPIPDGVPPGPHTVQLNGVAADGSVRTLSVGVVVRAPEQPAGGDGARATSGEAARGAAPAGLAFTGAHAATVSLVGLLLLLVGTSLLGSARRRAARRG